MKILSIGAAIAALSLGAAGVATAGNAAMTASPPATHAAAVLGKHSMPGKVTRIDHRSGMVHVNSYGMHLVVHFPPSSIAGLKVGDAIVLHLGYSKAH